MKNEHPFFSRGLRESPISTATVRYLPKHPGVPRDVVPASKQVKLQFCIYFTNCFTNELAGRLGTQQLPSDVAWRLMRAQQLTILPSIHLLCQSDEWNKETSALLPKDLVCSGGEMHVKGILLWMAHTFPRGIKTISLCSCVRDSRTKSFSSPELTQRHGLLMFHSASRMNGSPSSWFGQRNSI